MITKRMNMLALYVQIMNPEVVSKLVSNVARVVAASPKVTTWKKSWKFLKL